MWVLKGTFLGISIFGIGFTLLTLPTQWGSENQTSTDIRSIYAATIYNPWMWAAFAASIVIGLAIVRSWPGRFSPVFWVVLVVMDLVPAGLLGLFLLVLSKLKHIAAAIPK